MSEVLGRGIVEISADKRKLDASLNEVKRSIKSLGDSTATNNQRAAASIDRYVKSLTTQAAIQGKSTREAELYKLQLRGATDAQLRAANSALKLTESYQRGIAIGDKMRSNARVLGQGLIAVGVAAAGGAVALDRMIKSAGNFQDIGETIGDSAENVASLAVAAGTTSTEIDKVATASVKLTKNLTGVDDESKDAGAAIKALGLDIKAFKELAPVDQLEAIAKALNGFEEGPQKAAVAMALFGKAGADLLPFLKELGQEGARQVVLTNAQIKAADDYTDAQAKARTEIGLYAQVIGVSALDAISDFVKASKDLIAETAGVGTEANKLKANTSVADFAESAAVFLANLVDVARRVGQAFSYVGKTIGATAAIAAAASRGSADAAKAAFSFDPSGVTDIAGRQAREIATIVKEARIEGEKEFGTFNSFADKVEASIAARKGKAQQAVSTDPRILGQVGTIAEQTAANNKRPKLPFEGVEKKAGRGGGVGRAGRDAERDAAQLARASLDADLKFLRDKLSEERDTIAFHEHERSALYQAGNLSLREFYDERAREIANGVQRELNLLTDEQARLEVERDSIKDPSDPERSRLQTQIDESVSRSSRVVVESARSVRLSKLEEDAAFKQLSETISTYREDVLLLQGDVAGAAEIQTRRVIEQAKALAKQAEQARQSQIRTPGDLARFDRGQGSGVDVEALAQAATQSKEINAAKMASGAINERLAIQEERIALAQKTGAITEIAALQQIGAARAGIVAKAEAQVQELERLAAERPLDIQVNLDAERARLELDLLKESLDPLKDKFDEVFRDAGSGAIADFLNGTKTAKQALLDFGRSILTSINSTIAKQASEQLFGKDGVLGGAGGIVARMFGPKPADSIGASAFGSGKAPQIDTSAVTASLTSLQTVGIDPASGALVRLQSVGIDPTISAFSRLQSAVDSAAASVGKGGSGASGTSGTSNTSGEQSVIAQFGQGVGPASSRGPTGIRSNGAGGTTNDLVSVPALGGFSAQIFDDRTKDQWEKVWTKSAEITEASGQSTVDFGKTVAGAASTVAQLANAAGQGGGALSLLPNIVAAIASASAASAGGSGGSGSVWGALLNAAMSYFSSSYSFNSGVGTTNAAGISGGREAGGPVGAGEIYRVNEAGPELLNIAGKQFLLMGNQPGVVIPNDKALAPQAEIASAPRAGLSAANIEAMPAVPVVIGAGSNGASMPTPPWEPTGGTDRSIERMASIERDRERIHALRIIDGSRAAGGPVAPGRVYRVNERGTEGLAIAGERFLMLDSADGTIRPADNALDPSRNLAPALMQSVIGEGGAGGQGGAAGIGGAPGKSATTVLSVIAQAGAPGGIGGDGGRGGVGALARMIERERKTESPSALTQFLIGSPATVSGLISELSNERDFRSVAELRELKVDGARALGGSVSAGGMYRVTERGPEVVTIGGDSYLMMGKQGGSVTPNSGGAGSAGQQQRPIEQHFHFKESKPSRETLSQVAERARRGLAEGTRNS